MKNHSMTRLEQVSIERIKVKSVSRDCLLIQTSALIQIRITQINLILIFS